MNLSDHELIYLYCVTGQKPDLRPVERLVDQPDWIVHRDLYAVVSKVAGLEFNEENLQRNFHDAEWLKLKVKRHEAVVEGIMQFQTVVPFKFATLFQQPDSVAACLERNYDTLKTALLNLSGREEWGVKVYCDRRKLLESLGREDEAVVNLDREIAQAAPGKAFFLKKQRADVLQTAVDRKVLDYSQEFFERLSEYALQARLNACWPGEVTPQKEEMILNAAFLVEKLKHSGLLGAVYRLKADYEDQGLRLDCTGPWPPYNFCQFSKAVATSEAL